MRRLYAGLLILTVAASPPNPSTRTFNAGATCERQLSNNELLVPPFVVPDQGHRIVIHNGSKAHAFIKITGTGYRELYFVDNGGSATSLPLSDGTYRIQYAIGGRLAADCETVIAPQSAGEFPQQDLSTRRTEEGFELVTISFTLYKVRRGNVRTKTISVAEFNKD